MAEKFSKALSAYNENQYSSVSACAVAFGVPRSTLSVMIREKRDKWRGRGQRSVVFTEEEEEVLKRHVIERCELGVGLTIHEVCHQLKIFH